jgi:hypothetical protein
MSVVARSLRGRPVSMSSSTALLWFFDATVGDKLRRDAPDEHIGRSQQDLGRREKLSMTAWA